MKHITAGNIGECISEALNNGSKNILFIHPTADYKNALEWFKANPSYRKCRSFGPELMYEQTNGFLTKTEDCYCIPDDTLARLNNESSIMLVSPFSAKVIGGFDGFLDILKHRHYINRFPDGSAKAHSVEKMALLIAFTTPDGSNDYALDKDYYPLFDRVYFVD